MTKSQRQRVIDTYGSDYKYTDIPAKWRITRCLHCQNYFLKRFKEEETCPKCIGKLTK